MTGKTIESQTRKRFDKFSTYMRVRVRGSERCNRTSLLYQNASVPLPRLPCHLPYQSLQTSTCAVTRYSQVITNSVSLPKFHLSRLSRLLAQIREESFVPDCLTTEDDGVVGIERSQTLADNGKFGESCTVRVSLKLISAFNQDLDPCVLDSLMACAPTTDHGKY